jgi:hypothetical protein
VRTFWDSQKGILPDELKLTVSPIIDVYDRVTGDLTASYVAGTAPLVVAGTSATGYAGGAGVKVTWNTGQIRNGRRVRGSTFIVPTSSSIFGPTGTVVAGNMTSINASATALISTLNAAATPLAVWSRPFNGDNARVGFATEVIQGLCSSKSAILRGRRD